MIEAAGDLGATTHDQIIFALVGVVGASVAALVFVIRTGRYARTGAEQATAANAAVNHTKEGDRRLYDLVDRIKDDVAELKAHQRRFDSHGWDALPDDIGDAPNLTATIRSLQRSDELLHAKIDAILGELRDHVEWEMTQKYGRDHD